MLPWNWKSRSPRVKPVKPAGEPLTLLALTWLAVALTLAALPHIGNGSVWPTGLFVAVAGWRWFIAIRNKPLPRRGLLLALAVLAGVGVLFSYSVEYHMA